MSILTSPSTTGEATTSFDMLGDIIIVKPNVHAYIAFTGKSVIDQTLNKTVPKSSQANQIFIP